jgi:hypothetical protein
MHVSRKRLAERKRPRELDSTDVVAARVDGRTASEIAIAAYERLAPLRNPQNGHGPTATMRKNWLESLKAAAARQRSAAQEYPGVLFAFSDLECSSGYRTSS